jgi:Pentapeptide repeats (8 copies)
MRVMRAIHAHWIISFPLILACYSLCELQAQTPPSADQLTQAQIENQRAQATYYQRQADKRGFWRSLREYGGPIGAAVAAVVAIVSFGLNYRATLRSRADTKFYETLNLFADREHPGVRPSATGSLEQMASTGKRYYQTTFEQLCAGLLSEQEDGVRNSIQLALGRMAQLDPITALSKLEAVNRTLRDKLAESFCRLCAARGVRAIEQISDAVWEEAEEITSYDRKALTGLLEISSKDSLVAALTAAAKTFRTLGKLDDNYRRTQARIEMSEIAERLRSIIKSIGEVFLVLESQGKHKFFSGSSARGTAKSLSFAFLVGGKFRDLRGCRICRSILREADFTGANLKRAVLIDSDFSNATFGNAKLCRVKCSGTKFVGTVLSQADLTGAKFQDSDFTGADLTGTRFRNTAIAPAVFERTEWWKADFRFQRDLLKEIHSKYKKNLPDLESLYVRGDIHRSVLDFIGRITEEHL